MVPETKLEYTIENQRLREVNAELLKALEDIHRQADGWCCSDDSGSATMRFEDIADQARAAIRQAKGEDND